MTLQVVCVCIEGEIHVQLHGWLRDPEIPAFQTTCESQASPPRIDLENLSGASADGIRALKEQQTRGARLSGASPYIELLLTCPARSANPPL